MPNLDPNHKLWAVLAVAVGFWLMPNQAQAEPPKGKLSVPDAAAQKEVLATIRDTYQDDYKKSDKSALARMLIQEAKETQDATDRFVLLREAQNIAADALQIPLAIEAVDTMAGEFAISSSEMMAEVVQKAAEKARTAEQKKLVAEAALEIVDEAICEDNFAVAKQMVRRAGRLVRLQETAAKSKQVDAMVKAYADAREATATLKEKPDDPDANLAVGKYLCLAKGDWDKGLPMLAKGSDEELKTLAEKDIAGADSANKRVKLGDDWWRVSKERARYWYKQALPGLTGLQRDRVEKRVEEARPNVATIEYLADLKPISVDVCRNPRPPFVVSGVSVLHGIWGHPPADGRNSKGGF